MAIEFSAVRGRSDLPALRSRLDALIEQATAAGPQGLSATQIAEYYAFYNQAITDMTALQTAFGLTKECWQACFPEPAPKEAAGEEPMVHAPAPGRAGPPPTPAVPVAVGALETGPRLPDPEPREVRHTTEETRPHAWLASPARSRSAPQERKKERHGQAPQVRQAQRSLAGGRAAAKAESHDAPRRMSHCPACGRELPPGQPCPACPAEAAPVKVAE